MEKVGDLAMVDRETFLPCTTCLARQKKGTPTPDSLCRGCRHNRTAIAWLRQQLASMQKTAAALAPVEEIPAPTVRLKAGVCPHETARFSNERGFICLKCGDVGLYEEGKMFQALYVRVEREKA